ncbi:hypothetical protein [Micromonospora costi]|uniref:Uncharacterized protein n=1 Tax=Micromonospora costi TaxID=1530042 RepID=A0A3B0A9N8_9ACTN|nr:hypothetical protein [Micromonospora costi]RKN55906.1 hypothetical protein D7193_15050 [Micromonospora costi]
MNCADLLGVGLVLLVGGLVVDVSGPIPGVGVSAFWLGAGALVRGLWLLGRAAERGARRSSDGPP